MYKIGLAIFKPVHWENGRCQFKVDYLNLEPPKIRVLPKLHSLSQIRTNRSFLKSIGKLKFNNSTRTKLNLSYDYCVNKAMSVLQSLFKLNPIDVFADIIPRDCCFITIMQRVQKLLLIYKYADYFYLQKLHSLTIISKLLWRSLHNIAWTLPSLAPRQNRMNLASNTSQSSHSQCYTKWWSRIWVRGIKSKHKKITFHIQASKLSSIFRYFNSFQKNKDVLKLLRVRNCIRRIKKPPTCHKKQFLDRHNKIERRIVHLQPFKSTTELDQCL